MSISLEDALLLQASEIMALSASDLKYLQDESTKNAKKSKEIKEWIDGLIAMKYEEKIKSIREQQRKTTGTIRFKDSDIEIISELPKRITWDQEKLISIAKNITENGGNPSEYMAHFYKIEENKYTTWSDQLKNMFLSARTLKTGKHNIRMEKETEPETEPKTGK